MIIRRAISSGALGFVERVLREGERLDTVAGEVYNDGQYWWVIAAASDIGWALQAPPGALMRIPNLKTVIELVG